MQVLKCLPSRIRLKEEHVDSLSFSQEKQKHLLASDFGLFTALWWPDAPVEQLEVLAYLIIWLFTWDDEIDEPSGSFSEDFAAAESYRNDTLKFVGICLGLTPKEPGFVPKNHIVQSFDVIGAALRSSYDTTQCRRFYDEIAGLMAASQLEQDHRLSGNLPTLEEYWTFRLGTSAVYIGTAVGEYSLSVRLPLHIMQSESMKSIWTETNIIISITNDLLSLRKEIVRGCIDSIVPLAFVSMDDTSTVIAHTINALRASKNRFDLAAEALVGEARQSNCIDDVQRFIQVQRSNCVGNLVWR